MANLKLTFDDFESNDFELLAIHSNLKDFKLTFLINLKLNVLMAKNDNEISIIGSNDNLEEISGKLSVKLIDFSGKELWAASKECSLDVEKNTNCLQISNADLPKFVKEKTVLQIEFSGNHKNTVAYHYFVKPKDLLLEKPTIEIYPNPATSLVNILVEENTSYQLISIDGTTIAKGEFLVGNNVLNTESLSAGVYFFDCVGLNTGRFIQKLQKIE